MAVRPLRDGRYVVETDGGTYVVDVEAGACTCPDHSIRGARCKHLRRVAIEITRGDLPPPGQRTAVCAVCGGRVHVPVAATGPQLCDRHEHAPGDLVRDRETGSLLLVVDGPGPRADEATTREGRTVAAYPSNRHYGGQEPAFDAVYLDSLSPADVATGVDLPRYRFPASRLHRVERGFAPDHRDDAEADEVRGAGDATLATSDADEADPTPIPT